MDFCLLTFLFSQFLFFAIAMRGFFFLVWNKSYSKGCEKKWLFPGRNANGFHLKSSLLCDSLISSFGLHCFGNTLQHWEGISYQRITKIPFRLCKWKSRKFISQRLIITPTHDYTNAIGCIKTRCQAIGTTSHHITATPDTLENPSKFSLYVYAHQRNNFPFLI